MVPHFELFVYGTLRRGGPAAWLLDGCEFRGVTRVRGTLFNIEGRFPALVLEGGGDVAGEIWRCPAAKLAELDAFEGVADGLFRRERIQIAGVPCWIYVAGAALEPLLASDRRIPSGEWLS